MGMEIEHKYLVKGDSYRWESFKKYDIMQGFLSRDPERTVRVRVLEDKAFITIKGKGHGAAHPEFEYEVPVEEARLMLELCEPPIISKTRYLVMHRGNRWEVDEFHGDMQGLVIAELEVPSEDYKFPLPPFVGLEVTGDPRYYNSQLGVRQ